MRPKQVVNSELRITEVIDVIENQYINPFGLDINKDKLINISSGTSWPQNVANEVLNQLEQEKGLTEDFRENRIFNLNTKSHKPITISDCKSFVNSKKSCIVKNMKNGVR